MAPEYQIQKRSSRASDIYSVGCIVAEALTGLSPIDMYSLAELRIVWRDFVPKDRIISEAFSEIVDQMLSPNPATRFTTVSEVLAALEDPEFKRTEEAIDTLIGVYQGPIKPFAEKIESGSFKLLEKIASANCHDGTTTALCWTFDGLRLISGSDDGTLAITTPGQKVQHIR